MHLVCLGVMKKLLLLWRGEKRSANNRRQRKTKRTNKQAKHRVFRLSAIAQTTLNDKIIALSKCFPVEFQRKGRNLDFVGNRRLESGRVQNIPSLQKADSFERCSGVLSDEQYEHFLYFHTASRILCSLSSTEEQITNADQCLKYFSFQFCVLYESYKQIYNFHSINHFADDCRF